MWPSSTTTGTSCRPGLFWDNEQNSVQNIKKIKGNLGLVKVEFLKVSLQFLGIGYHWKACYIFISRQDVPFIVMGHKLKT